MVATCLIKRVIICFFRIRIWTFLSSILAKWSSNLLLESWIEDLSGLNYTFLPIGNRQTAFMAKQAPMFDECYLKYCREKLSPWLGDQKL
mmetsp:Transcript_1770/g.2507  ORF Transcript_1770/g.2507 Transcript_1770/m.2507 type:complete len:90 (-) Transcript_1770:1374-1643(-)